MHEVTDRSCAFLWERPQSTEQGTDKHSIVEIMRFDRLKSNVDLSGQLQHPLEMLMTLLLTCSENYRKICIVMGH